MMENYYGLPTHQLTVGMVCNHAIDQALPQGLVLDMMSYLYGVYEDIAVYGNDAYTRHNAVVDMNTFDEAVNELDGEDFETRVRSMTTQNGAVRIPPGFDEAHMAGGSPPMTPVSALIHPPLSPPPLVRRYAATADVWTPEPDMIHSPMSPPEVVRRYDETGDVCSPIRDMSHPLMSPPEVVRHYPDTGDAWTPEYASDGSATRMIHNTIGTILADTDDDDSEYENSQNTADFSSWTVSDNSTVQRRLFF